MTVRGVSVRLVAASVLLVVGGCSRSADVGQVRGTVTLDGKPLSRATVTFEAEDGSQMAYGETDAQGEYELKARGTLDLPVGPYRVRVETYRVETGADGQVVEVPESLPARYNAETELQHEVTPGPQRVDWPLESGSKLRSGR